MTPRTEDLILKATGGRRIARSEPVQTLWSGYGLISRVWIDGGEVASVIVKEISPPETVDQPRGWNTDQSHQRKLQSYRVEAAWYADWAIKTDSSCRVPQCLGIESGIDGHSDAAVIVMEDLNAIGLSHRHGTLSVAQPGSNDWVRKGLSWLASFHAKFLQIAPDGLWPIGTYWHLDTRPDELAAMAPEDPLRRHAHAIDRALRRSPFQTIVHGDAKVANFCFASEFDPKAGDDLAVIGAVDFQYVGGGIGVQDVAYFLGSCLSENECAVHADELLGFYFDRLAEFIESSTDVQPKAFERLRSDWMRLYPVAWADFNRFLVGWYPSHQKLHAYSRAMSELALSVIDAG